ncbi:MAG: CRISPR-associated helicase Cas3' [Thaumarchaeota archaeon]|nr:CRISPR-associated helicase Cas3' [Nitrososphaerota archaeon]
MGRSTLSANIFLAHSENKKGKRHELREHLVRTAELAESFSPTEEIKQLFYSAGILHDVGKFQDGFQKYLEYGKPRTPHAGIGAFIARQSAKQYLPLPFVIKGHHAGLPDKQDLIEDLNFYEDDSANVDVVLQRFRDTFQTIESNGKLSITDHLEVECLTRLLFSAVTDADWLDTEHHFSEERTEARSSQRLDQDNLCEQLLGKLEEKFKRLPTEGNINALRTRARIDAAKRAKGSPGFFSLQLPTGLGKTLTSVYWALLHANQNQQKRIIIVLPYINIIDQTASILKGIFGEDAVLEHHSGIVDDDDGYAKEELQKDAEMAKQLATENWDAPIIITTSVQFFGSLFSNKPFKCRKNHNVSESVVIFDEIQTLPKHLAEPTVIMLKNISALSKTTFLFCTATLPAFEKREGFNGIERIRPLVESPIKYFESTQRVHYKMLNGLKPVTVDGMAEELLNEKTSFLAIVNTKSVAKEFFRKISGSNKHDGYYHLSTAMCPHHRKRVISDIIQDLHGKRRIGVVSTQLVEAGVDLDFPCVYRAMAPLDAIIQAAGRCNRNGDPTGPKGKVVVFKLEQQKFPDGTYQACADLTETRIKNDSDFLYRIDSFENYYRAVAELLVDTDKYRITEERRSFNFKTVNEQYKIIDSPTVPLFIAGYSEDSASLLGEVTNDLQYRGYLTREQYRKMQQFSVQVYRDFLKKNSDQVETIKDTLRVWHGMYDDKVGLLSEDVETVF